MRSGDGLSVSVGAVTLAVMRFGAFVPQGWRIDLAGIDAEQHWPTMLGVARDIERLGYESLWVYDHFHTIPEQTQEATYEAWTLMAALAATTESVRLGQMCTCNTYRPPSYLAKVAASVDVISAGRLEMGIGAGWYREEHEGYGYPFLPPGGRLGMLREGIEIMKAMWVDEVVDYVGKHYRLEGAICQPKPVQQPHIPIWVAGGGEKVTLRLAAIYGQYSNFGIELEAFKHKSGVLSRHCDEVGTDFAAITRSANFNVMCAPTEAEVEEKKGWLADHMRRYVSEAEAERFAHLYNRYSGTPEQVISWLKEWEAEGLGYTIVNCADAAYDRSSLELIAAEVIPAFR